MTGKGDKRRPAKVGTQEFSERWNYIFNKDDPTEEETIEKMKMEAQTFRDSKEISRADERADYWDMTYDDEDYDREWWEEAEDYDDDDDDE